MTTTTATTTTTRADKADARWLAKVGTRHGGYTIVTVNEHKEQYTRARRGTVLCHGCNLIFEREVSQIINRPPFGCASCTAVRREDIKRGIFNNYDQVEIEE